MAIKDDLLEVTARLFAGYGWRGTTTRRIAEAAGVNEVTLFRHFRSKDLLVSEAVRTIAREVHQGHDLPAVPVDLRRERTEWALSQHSRLRKHGPMILACLAEFEEHPALAPVACEGALANFAAASAYLGEARRRGLIGAKGSIDGAVMMLMNAVFMDAVTRDVIDSPRPVLESDAISDFVDLTLRALGAPEDG